MSWFTHLIGDKGDILWWQMSIRAVLILTFGLLLIRLFSRRAFGRQNPLDIVVSIVVGSNLSRTLTGNSPFLPTLAGTAALVILFWLLELGTARWHSLGYLLKGEAVRLAHNHQFDRDAMKRWGVTDRDLEEAARSSGMPGLETVKHAVLERSGKISTIGES